MNDFVRVEGLCKSYKSGERRLSVIEQLELALPQRKLLAITGESGSGKSTFLHLVGAMEQPDQGEIRIGDAHVGRMNSVEKARFRNARIGFVFQFHHLLPEFSAVENVMMPLLLRRENARSARQRAGSILQQVGLAERKDHRPGELSGGEQQRVAFARALVGRPSLLLADEPTGNLDAKTSGAIHELLLSIHRRHNLTSIVVTHDPALADICDIRMEMVNGRLRADQQV